MGPRCPISDQSHDRVARLALDWCRHLMASQPTGPGSALADLLHRVCLAVPAGLDLSGAAVILGPRRDSETLTASSDPASAQAAELEHTLGEGPSRDAVRIGRPVLVDDLADDHPWVAYGTEMTRRGFVSVFSFPLHVGATRFGVLTMYGRAPQHLDHLRTARCLALAELATEALLLSTGDGSSAQLPPSLNNLLDVRVEIFQAQGMAMVTLGTDLSTALARMRAHAYQTERSLHEVSLDILAGRLTLTDDGPDSGR